MSGLVGHVMYAILGERAAAARRSPIAPVLRRHWSCYLCGAYLGCDVQTMPEAICVDTGQEVGYGTVPLDKSPLTGGAVRPWTLKHADADYTPRQIHERFYGRAHLVFGWSKDQKQWIVPWDHLADYAAAVLEDALDQGPAERPVAYAFGWLAHIVGDCLVKSIQPGFRLHLLDGSYTARNRPIQDLVAYHELGREDLGLDWPALLTDLAATPVEPTQLHYMRVGPMAGRLGERFPVGWAPEDRGLLTAVLSENRRYLKVHLQLILADMTLLAGAGGPECAASIRQTTGGLTYQEMRAAAVQAGLRQQILNIGAAVADLFGQVVERVPRLRQLSAADAPTWQQLNAK